MKFYVGGSNALNIGEYAFYNTPITTVVIPKRVSKIERRAFNGCNKLERISLNEATTTLEIDEFAFNREGNNVAELIFVCDRPFIYTSKYTYEALGSKGLFFMDTHLKEVIIGAKVTNIPAQTFNKCSNLSTLTMTNASSLQTIEGYAFANTNLSSVTIPASVITVKNYAFNPCSNLTAVCLQNSSTTVEPYAFPAAVDYNVEGALNWNYKDGVLTFSGEGEINGNNALWDRYKTTTTSIVIEEGITKVDQNCFKEYSALKNVTIANASAVVAAFSNMNTLESITVKSGMMANGAFANCRNLKTINIGASVTKYNGTTRPFENCPFTTINVINDEEHPTLLGKDVWISLILSNSNAKTLLFNGKEKEVVVLDYETVLPRTFQKITNVKKIVLTDKVKYIGEYSFAAETKHITCYGNPALMSGSNYPAMTFSTNKSTTIHFKPNTTTPYYPWSDYFTVLRNAGDVTLNRSEADADEEGPIQLEVVNLEGDVTWSTNGSGYATVDENGLVSLNKNFVYNGQTGWFDTVTATVDGKSGEFVAKYIPSKVELTDGMPFLNSEAVETESIKYTRNFTVSYADDKTKWQPLCIPFSFDVADYKNQFETAELYAFVPLDDSNGDGRINSNDEHFMVVQIIDEGKTIPGLPYLIRPLTTGECVIESADGILATSKEGTVTFSTARWNYAITGLLNHSVIANNDNHYYYISSNGKVGSRTTGSTTIKPNRWYMTVSERTYGDVVPETNNAPNQASFRIVALGEDIDEETAIRLINGDYSTISNNNGLFTIEGVRITNPENLSSGMYIKNGKKIFLHK